MTKSLIDKITGQLRFGNDFIVDGTTTPKEIIQYFGQSNIDTKNMQTGWKHYSVRNYKLNGTYFIFTFYYKDDTLKMLDFVISEIPFGTTSWMDWSEQKELEMRDNYNDWLTKEIGKERNFSWGTIDAFYDKKSGGSSIFLKYK